MSPAELYDRDFFLWTQRNAELLRTGQLSEADLEHIAEEIEDMGKSRKDALESRFMRLISHLLKWQFQPEKRSRSWQVTIVNQRVGIERLLRENPSFRAALLQTVTDAYGGAVRLASVETNKPRREFPAACPFTLEQLLDEDYLP